jgi:hypothetical protein
MKRRKFIKTAAAATGVLLLAPAMVACTGQDLSIDRALGLITALKSAPSLQSRGDQTPFQIIMHCTQSIECALVGYPEMKPAWFQSSIGMAAFHVFSLMDKMEHDRNAAIPGMPVPERDGKLQEALSQLEDSFRKLKAAQAVKPHFFFGKLSQKDMERAQVMHFLNHLEQLDWKVI